MESLRSEAHAPIREAMGSAAGALWDAGMDKYDQLNNAMRGMLTGGVTDAAMGYAGVPQTFTDDPEGTTGIPYVMGNPMIDVTLGMDDPIMPSAGVAQVPNTVIEGIGNFVADIGNLPGPGMFAKGNRLLDAAGAARDNKGMLLASTPNMLPNFYNPGNQAPSMLEDLIQGPLTNIPTEGAQFTNTVAGKRKVEGVVKTLAGGLWDGFLDMFSPTARANWKQGISANSQRIVRNIIERHEGPVPSLGGGSKRGAGRGEFKPNPEYPVPYLRQPKFDKLWDNKEWRTGYLKDKQNLYNQTMDEAFAQAIYNSHMIDQSGMVVPKMHESMQEIRKRLSLQPTVVNEHGTIVAALRKHSGEVPEGYQYVRKADGSFKLNDEGKRIRRPKFVKREQSLDEAKIVEDHINNVQGLDPTAGTSSITVKPQAGRAGHHFNDVVARNPANNTQSNVIKDNWDEFNQTGRVPMDKFQKHWEDAELTQSGRNTWRIKSFDEDGVWITGSKTGRAIVEGGVNYIAKYRNDGTLMAVMSDKHDFLEKFPILGRLIRKMLPINKVAITPAMETNIFDLKPLSFSDKKYGLDPLNPAPVQTAAQKIPKVRPAAVTKDERTYPQLLTDYVEAKPQQDVLNAERVKVAGMLSTPIVPISNLGEE